MIRVLLFAQLRDQFNQAELAIDINLPCSVAELRQAAKQQFPQHAELLAPQKALPAINHELVDETALINNSHDEVALLPPMTGG